MSDPMVRKLARQLVGVDQRLRNLETVPQLAHSSIDDHGLPVYDKDGNLVSRIGKQADGTWGAPPLSGPTPPAPRGVTAVGGPGAITVSWTGEFTRDAAPLDFDVLEILVDGLLAGSIPDRDGGTATISAEQGYRFVAARVRTLVPRHSSTTSPFSVEVGPPADQLFIDAKEEIDGAKGEIDNAKQDIVDEREAREQALQEAQEDIQELDRRIGELPDSEALESIRSDLSDAVDSAQTALDNAATAQKSADDAAADALAAAGIARDKGRIYYQPTAPTADEAKSSNNLWIDSDDGAVYVWDEAANDWVESQSESLRDAAQAAAAALAAAEAAEARAQDAAAAAATAQAAAEAAQTTADQATTDARDAHNAAVEAQAGVDAALSRGDSLIINGSFEQGHRGWGTGARWDVVESDGARSGDHVMRITADGVNSYPRADAIPVRPGQVLHAQTWFKYLGGGGDSRLGVYYEFHDRDGVRVATGMAMARDGSRVYVYPPDIEEGEWVAVAGDIPVGEGDGAVTLTISPHVLRSDTGDSFDLDDVQVIDVTEARAAQARADEAYEEAASKPSMDEIKVEIATSANGKNAITISTAAPTSSTPGVATGDTWWRVDGSGDIFGQWVWNGNNWGARRIRSEVIANLDVSKLVVHGEARIASAVIEQLWVDGLAARAISAAKVAVVPGNDFPDPYFAETGMWAESNYRRLVPDAVPGGVALEIDQRTSLQGVYYGGLSNEAVMFEGGVKYRVRVLANFSDDSVDQIAVYFRVPRRGENPASYAAWIDRTAEATGQYAYVETEWTAPANAEGLGTAGLFVRAGTNSGSVRFAAPEVTRKVGAILLEDGSVGADKIVADEVAAEVSNLVRANVEKLVVTDGATIDEAVILKLATEMITAGVLRTSETGQRVVIDENGIVMYGVGPDGEDTELVRIGPSGENLLTIGDTTVSADSVSSPQGAFDQLRIGGTEIGDYLSQAPRGVIAWGRITQNSSFDSNPNLRARRAEIQTLLHPGRSYRVRLSSHFLDTSANNARVREYLHYSLDGVPIPRGDSGMANVSTGMWLRHYLIGNDVYAVPGMEFGLTTPNSWDGPKQIWVVYSTQTESSNWPVRLVAGRDYPVELSVEDLGPNLPRDIKRWNDNNEGSAQDPEPIVRRHVDTWNAGGWGGDISGGDVYQGTWPGVGNRWGGWIFSSGMISSLSGSTIEKFEIYLYATHWYWGSGGTAVLRANNGAYKTTSSESHNSANWPRNAGRWVTLPSSWYPRFASGYWKGVSVKADSSNLIYYGQFRGTAAKFRVTYRK